METFTVGQEVVRTKGDYVVGRVGVVVAVDLIKGRAQVDCGIKTWISFGSLALTSKPYRIDEIKNKRGTVSPKYVKL